MEYYSASEDETKRLGESFGRDAKNGDIYCLNGRLGAGKTVFCKGFAKGLEISDNVTSPTFTILNEYEGRLALYHFDAYRLENAGEALCFDFREYFDFEGVCLIEWADNIKTIIPKNAVFIYIDILDDEKRKISVQNEGTIQDDTGN